MTGGRPTLAALLSLCAAACTVDEPPRIEPADIAAPACPSGPFALQAAPIGAVEALLILDPRVSAGSHVLSAVARCVGGRTDRLDVCGSLQPRNPYLFPTPFAGRFTIGSPRAASDVAFGEGAEATCRSLGRD